MTDKRKQPIDIQYKQLLEALVDRRIVPNKWLEQYKQIRGAIACLEQSKEGAAKNLFGQYTSPVLKQWNALIRQYEKKNIYAAETARLIARNTAFEIPFLKKSIVQNEKQIADNNRKIADLTRNIAEYKRKLEVSCADMGIVGKNFRDELRRLPLELPNMFDKVVESICCNEIASAIEYHQALQTYLHDCEVPVIAPMTESSTLSSSQKDKKSKKKGKKLIEVVEESGATTDELFELVVVPHNFFDALKELCCASDELIDVNATFRFEAEAEDISWDISLGESSTADGNGFDWSIETVASAEPAATAEDTPVEIDWNITTSDVVKPVSEMNGTGGTDVVETVPDTPASVEKITRARLLGQSEFRTRAVNDLLELRAFLRQRLLELSGSDSVAFANQFQGSSPLLEQQSSAKIEEFQAVVDKALSLLTDKRLQQLVLIKTSERYLDRHVASLEMLTKRMDKCRREIHALEDKNTALIDAAKNVQPQINSLVITTKKLKKELEAVLPL
ncbi:unnamed protein product [Peronospora destructor]|uniref:CDK5 regulatory subunit-associated protein 3 n=1 Tax=Peronospora destructor TaxID=86335 RepID=A0AAV0TER3_9STRA|nr:unnamed protein product [Peronospora destructor]